MKLRGAALVLLALLLGTRTARAADTWEQWQKEVDADAKKQAAQAKATKEAEAEARHRALSERPVESESGSTPDHGNAEGWAYGFGTIFLQPKLEGARFSGEGRLVAGGPKVPFNHSGRELGVGTPLLAGADMAMTVFQKHFEVGVRLFVAGRLDGHDLPTNPDAARLADPSSVEMIGGGMHFAAALPLAAPLTLMIGPDAGVRSFSVPLPGFQETTCRTKYGSHPCPETATASQPYFQARAALQINTDSGGHRMNGGWFVTPWVGADAYPSLSVTAGITFGFSFGWPRR